MRYKYVIWEAGMQGTRQPAGSHHGSRVQFPEATALEKQRGSSWKVKAVGVIPLVMYVCLSVIRMGEELLLKW